METDHPSLSDVSDRLLQTLPTSEGRWTSRFSGMAIPSEAWVQNGTNQIGLFREERGVLVVVWVGNDMRSLLVDSPEKMDRLPEWILPHLAAQTTTNRRIADEERKRAAIQPPPLEEVLAALMGGTRIQLGGGRWHETYFITDGILRREVFDEGLTSEESAPEEDLRRALAANAEQAHRQLPRP